ncbi:BLUF domain-containing protein [Cellulomonas sp. S1-8]|uniref:BLUF domain-containing protein n=1 Tax=Cellulomonas sp. S1-8 TaxID=2904790 RepID=UPI00224394F6|nr:BLUF domain-containing protein [Cellulomonas sp. S1-8]UZN05216.1 BLUF domain-containing protein [Cellulomonas sp. S1-8]
MLAQMLYFSEAVDPGNVGILKILENARKNNSSAHVSGVLLFDRNYFLQCLEGGREALTTLFARIAADERHTHVTLMSMHEIGERDFPDWTMGYVSSSPTLTKSLARFLPTDQFAPERMSCASATGLMKSLRATQGTV